MAYGCLFCFWKPEDQGKYEFVIKRGTPRVKLIPICETLYICPKCGFQHVGPGFKDEKAIVQIRERKRKRNIEQLKAQYRLP